LGFIFSLTRLHFKEDNKQEIKGSNVYELLEQDKEARMGWRAWKE
jgi:hypothetical protein